MIILLARPVDDRSKVDTTTTEKKKTKSQPKEQKTDNPETRPTDFIKGLEGLYPWRPSDLRLLGLVIRAMKETIKDKDITKWSNRFSRVLREENKKI